jgi:hypothetical protein
MNLKRAAGTIRWFVRRRKRIWDYALMNKIGVLNQIPLGNSGKRGLEMVTGETPDISEWIDFKFYDHKKIGIDCTSKRLARWLGIAHCVGLIYL